MLRYAHFTIVLFVAIFFTACGSGPPDGNDYTPNITDPSLSTVRVDRSEGVLADGRDEARVTVTVRNLNGNPFPGRVVAISSDERGVKVEPSFGQSGPTGVFTATVTSTRAGKATLTVTVDEDVVLENAATIQFVAPGENRFRFDDEPSDVVAGKQMQPAVTVNLLDADGGAAVDDTRVSLSLTGGPLGDERIELASEQSLRGVAKFKNLILTEAGQDYRLIAHADGYDSAESARFDVLPDEMDEFETTFTTSSILVLADGKATADLVVQVRDRFQNLIPRERVRVVSTGDVVAVDEVGKTDDEGSFTVVVRSEHVGTETFTATVAGVDYDVTVSFQSGEAASLAFDLEPSHVKAGTYMSTVRIHILDQEGHLATGDRSEVHLRLDADNGAVLTGNASREAQGGIASFGSLRIDKTGVGYRLIASVDGLDEVISAPFDVTAGDPARLSFVWEPSNVVAGDAFPSITVEALDENGNRTDDNGIAVSLSLIDGENGTPALLGTKQKVLSGGRVVFDDIHVQKMGTNFALIAQAQNFGSATSGRFDIIPGPVDKNGSTFKGDPAQVIANGQDTARAVATANDRFGNPIAGVPVTISGGGTSQTCTTNAAGQCVEGRKASSLSELTLTANFGDFTKSTTLYFVAGPPSTQTSTFDVQPASGLVVGGSPGVVTVMARDSNGNPAEDVKVTLTADEEDVVFVPASGFAGKTNANGEFAATVQSEVAGTKRIKASFGGVVIYANITFVAADPYPQRSSVNIEPSELQIADGAHPYYLTVTAIDRFGNPVSGENVTITATGGGNIITMIKAKTDVDGVASGTIKSTVGGTKVISIKIGNVPLELDDPITVIFIGGQLIAGTVENLGEGTLRIHNVNGDNLALTNQDPAAFEFPTEVFPDDAYEVEIEQQPSHTQYCVVENGEGVVADDVPVQVTIVCHDLFDYVAVGATARHVMAIQPDGTLWGWGFQDGRRQIDGDDTSITTGPVPIDPERNWLDVAIGRDFSMAIRSNGSLWTWGNSLQQHTQVGSQTGWTTVAASGDSAYGIRANILYAWGNNDVGQLGVGGTSNASAPTAVDMGNVSAGSTWTSVVAGGQHAMALTTSGELYAWGNNDAGQLGDSSHTARDVPVRIGDAITWQRIAAGDVHSVGIADDGTLYLWGDNGEGQLADGGVADSVSTPRAVTIDGAAKTDWVTLASGEHFVLALDAEGQLWTWGSRTQTDGTTTQSNVPAPLGAPASWIDVAAIADTGFALKDLGDGHLSLWGVGYNKEGQLGQNAGVDATIMTAIQVPKP